MGNVNTAIKDEITMEDLESVKFEENHVENYLAIRAEDPQFYEKANKIWEIIKININDLSSKEEISNELVNIHMHLAFELMKEIASHIHSYPSDLDLEEGDRRGEFDFLMNCLYHEDMIDYAWSLTKKDE